MTMNKVLMYFSILSKVYKNIYIHLNMHIYVGWCQRKKADFKFKYTYLEDEK